MAFWTDRPTDRQTNNSGTLYYRSSLNPWGRGMWCGRYSHFFLLHIGSVLNPPPPSKDRHISHASKFTLKNIPILYLIDLRNIRKRHLNVELTPTKMVQFSGDPIKVSTKISYHKIFTSFSENQNIIEIQIF